MSAIVAAGVSLGSAVIQNIGERLFENAKSLATDKSMVNSKSLSQFTKDLHLRPRIAIERELLNDENMGTLVTTATSNYAAYFTLALSVENTIGGVSVGKIVGKYNSNASTENDVIDIVGDAVIDAVGKSSGLSRQSYDGNATGGFGFPTLPTGLSEKLSAQITAQSTKAEAELEAAKLNARHWKEKAEEAEKRAAEQAKAVSGKDSAETADVVTGSSTTFNASTDSSTAKELADAQNLAVGKLLEITVTREQASAKVQMLLKPSIRIIGAREIVGIGASGVQTLSKNRNLSNKDKGFLESAWDFLSAADLWKAHRKRLVEDTSGYYEEVHAKRRGSGARALLTGQWGVGEVANSWIISASTATRLEVGIRARLANSRSRDKFLEDVGVMTLIVFSPEHQRVKIYNHGLDEISDISLSYLMKKTKNKDFDFDIFKLMQQGSAPIL